jgi:uncharacterized protein YndB with AHSA1/START domain
MEPITVETHVNAPVENVWHIYTDPESVQAWNTPSSDWHTTSARNDLRVGGTFSYRMEAKDGSDGFDFTGEYDEVVQNERIAYTMSDGRTVDVTFSPMEGGTHVTVRFDPETQNTYEVQRDGWQAILDSFKRYTETHVETLA